MKFMTGYVILGENLMRADRLLSILLLLQVHQRMTASELAERLEVSTRTILRDMEALSMAGIPVVAARGLGGGWSLMEEYRTNLTGLNAAEAQALFLNPPLRLLQDLGLSKASEAAFIKALAALPGMARRSAEYIRQRIYIDSAGWHRSEENIAFLPVLQDAIWQECRLRLSYQRGEGEVVERWVDPLGLVAKGSVWYLVAGVDGEPRTYRVSRILDAQVGDEPCVRPENFNLAAYWEQSTRDFVASLPSYRVTARINPAILPLFRALVRFTRIEEIHPPDEDGWQKLLIRFDIEEEACLYTLGFGAQIEVLEPPELREKIVRMAHEVLELY
jgi:predicted DNA-binding transcriptional regulator YafY